MHNQTGLREFRDARKYGPGRDHRTIFPSLVPMANEKFLGQIPDCRLRIWRHASHR